MLSTTKLSLQLHIFPFVTGKLCLCMFGEYHMLLGFEYNIGWFNQGYWHSCLKFLKEKKIDQNIRNSNENIQHFAKFFMPCNWSEKRENKEGNPNCSAVWQCTLGLLPPLFCLWHLPFRFCEGSPTNKNRKYILLCLAYSIPSPSAPSIWLQMAESLPCFQKCY